MAFATAGAGKIAAPGRALAIVVVGNGERRAATAGHEKHPQRGFGLLAGFGLATGLHYDDSSTVA